MCLDALLPVICLLVHPWPVSNKDLDMVSLTIECYYFWDNKDYVIIIIIMNALTLAVQNPNHKCDFENNLRMIQSLTRK